MGCLIKGNSIVQRVLCFVTRVKCIRGMTTMPLCTVTNHLFTLSYIFWDIFWQQEVGVMFIYRQIAIHSVSQVPLSTMCKTLYRVCLKYHCQLCVNRCTDCVSSSIVNYVKIAVQIVSQVPLSTICKSLYRVCLKYHCQLCVNRCT